MPVSVDPQYSVAGFLVGLLIGQTGMGGGALMTPVLILLFGVHPLPPSASSYSTLR